MKSLLISSQISSFKALKDATELPCDISFQIVSSSTTFKKIRPLKSSEVAGKDNIFTAHKFLLSAYSPVFRSMFFGPLGETSDMVTIEDTTVKAFGALIDYVYQKDVYWSGSSWNEVFDIVYLADKYQMTDLLEILKEYVREYCLIKDDAMVNLARSAFDHSHFPDISEAAIENCVQYVRRSRPSNSDLFKFAKSFVKENKDDMILSKVVCLASTVRAEGCENCGVTFPWGIFTESKCNNGAVILKLREEARFGLKIKVHGKAYMVMDKLGDSQCLSVISCTTKLPSELEIGDNGKQVIKHPSNKGLTACAYYYCD